MCRFSASLMRGLAWSILLLCVQAGTVFAQRLPTADEREILLKSHLLPPELSLPPVARGLQDDFDALRYDLALLLDVENSLLEGEVTVTFSPQVSGFATLELDLRSDTMDVFQVVVGDNPDTGRELPFEHLDHQLRVFFDPPLEPGAASRASRAPVCDTNSVMLPAMRSAESSMRTSALRSGSASLNRRRPNRWRSCARFSTTGS